ncbi:MAG: putative glycolipid-binding domain-containing protein, partial [Paracoccaceae bacterium]
LPIKRLNLSANESREILAAYVPLPSQIEDTFVPTRAEQRYTCIEVGKLYRYEGLFRNFTAELEIDRAGIVLDYPDTFKRLR